MMTMMILFKILTLINFKSHRDLIVNFSRVTEITGDNAKGKSSIFEAITWLLYGITPFSGKSEPVPITYESEGTEVTLLLEVDGKQLLLGRELKKGKTTYFVNEVPSKATEFNDILAKLFTKELFLSLFNPNYFFSMHWKEQREMLLKYVVTPANKEVLKVMNEPQSEALEPLLKKNSLSEVEKIHRAKKNTLEKEYIAAQSRAKTMAEMLDRKVLPTAPIESLKVELDELKKKLHEKNGLHKELCDKEYEYFQAKFKVDDAQRDVTNSKKNWEILKNEVIEDTCPTCKRKLDEEAIKEVKADKQKRMEHHKNNHVLLVNERDTSYQVYKAMKPIDLEKSLNEITALQNEIQSYEKALGDLMNHDTLKADVDEAKRLEAETFKELNNSIFVLDCVKEFQAKEAELQGDKVQALFKNLSVRLFDIQKNGEIKPTFEIEMNDTPYSKLSLSESIKAGLELREVLAVLNTLNIPVFIDNSESITNIKEPNSQLIISRVVAGQELKIAGGSDEK